MDWQTYVTRSREFVRYPQAREREYLALGLIAEVGELAGVVAKAIRKDVDVDRERLADELSDIY